MKTNILFIVLFLIFGAFLFTACGSGSEPTADKPIQGKVIASGPVGGLTVAISNETGKLAAGEQEIMLAFTDSSGKAANVTAASLNLSMPAMGSMAPMNNAAVLTTTKVSGVFRGKLKIQMSGEWQAQITYEGAGGNGKTSVPVTVN